LVDFPNQSPLWWHSIPLPDGNRINGCNQDKDLQFKLLQAMRIDNEMGLANKKILDIGANDGFFTLAAIMAGAQEVTAIDKDWMTWPRNIQYVCQIWNVNPEIISADFHLYEFYKKYDVIFFFGVLYHLKDVFSCVKILRDILEDNGVLYLETQMSAVQSDLPIFEYASDKYPTVAVQDKKSHNMVGISNYLFPNEPAIRNLAYSYDFHCEKLDGPHNMYSKQNPNRQVFKFVKQPDNFDFPPARTTV
jgi:hypothetical protein